MPRLPHTLGVSSRTALALVVVVVISNITYFRGYGVPRGSFYDEAIYVADAQKYLSGVFFMQDHPPLGKLLIAAGERLMHANSDAADALFLANTVAPEFPVGYSFLGYRLFPALLAWWTAPLLFLVFLHITGSRILSLLLTSWYVFDNALIVHLRGALLEGPLVFFTVLTVYLFLRVHRSAPNGPSWGLHAAFGASLALAVTSKEAALILFLLVPALVWQFRDRLRAFAELAVASGVAFLCVYVAVWQIHFALARAVNPALPNDGYFDASPAYKKILAEGRSRSLLSDPVMMRDAWRYTASWNRNLQPLDLCDAKEIGSPVYYWPLGARTINYRSETTDGQTFRYLYLQSNPVVWWTGLGAVIAATLALAWAAVRRPFPVWPNRPLLFVLTAMYWSYLIGLGFLSRVLYLHAYFIPLVLSFVIGGLLVADLARLAEARSTGRPITGAMAAMAALVVASFLFYAPLTYYQPLTEAQFQRRAIVKLWDLRCGSCPARPRPAGCPADNRSSAQLF